jgi:dihydropteroate synthase-like protein
MSRPKVLFVTGRLAEPALRRVLQQTASDFDSSIAVLPISVVALAPTAWIARHLDVPPGTERVVLPGLCPGDLAPVSERAGAPSERGPKDLRDLPEYLGSKAAPHPDYGRYDIAILAEINDVQRLSLTEIRARARAYRDSGADVIDLGCHPGESWAGAADTVRALCADGFRVSIDSFNPADVARATAAGAELVLSVNGTNREAARDWGREVVAIPDDPATLGGLDTTVEHLARAGVPFRIDPVIEPIGFGFAASLGRYLEVRRRYPDAAMLMGVGNLTELTEVDSAGVNLVLLGFCQEVGIQSVLTTEVINWCRSAVRELDLARRLVHHACRERVLPKHVTSDLLLLRDPKLLVHGEQTLEELAEHVSDPNFRLFAERGQLHVLNDRMFLHGADPFALFARMLEQQAIDPAHAFYLGYELAKAVTALTLGKNYVQDQPLRWGFLTTPEETHVDTMGAPPEPPAE